MFRASSEMRSESREPRAACCAFALLITRVARLVAVITLAAQLVSVPMVASAQSESGSAGIEGVVTDANNGVVSKATVRIRNLDTGYTRTIVTDAHGHYTALIMPVGTYRVEVSGEGFATARYEAVQLTVGNRQTLNVSLRPPTVGEGVVVSGNPAAMEREEMATSSSIGARWIGDLPIRGRNFPEFAKLTPGVIQESDRFGLVVSGQRSVYSTLAIDGTDFTDPLQGNQRGGNEPSFFFPQTAVREFQVVRAGATVEVGRTNAGFINVVTKSGGNGWHGEALFLNRNEALTSEDAFGRTINNKQNQFGGSIGGPIVKDRASFFVGAEQSFLSVPFFTTFGPLAAGVVLPSELASQQGEYQGTNSPTSVFSRADVTLNNRDSLNIQYTFFRQNSDNFNFEPLPGDAPSTNFTRDSSSHGLRIGFVSVFSSNLLNEARGQIATDNRDDIPNSNLPQVVIAGFGRLGSDASRPRAFDSTRYEVTDNLSVNRGVHQMRYGFDLNVADLQQERITILQGRYDFLSLTDYLNRKIDRYRQTLPASGPDDLSLHGVQKEVAFYAQDKIALRSDLTLTAGLRWEGQWNPQPVRPNPSIPQTGFIPNDVRLWQPRLGLAWNIAGTGRTVVRFSTGLYDARTPATLFQRVSTENGVSTLNVDTKADKTLFQFLTFPNGLTSVPAGVKLALPTIVGFDAGFKNPRSFQAAGAIERLVGKECILTAGYTHNSTYNLQRRVDRNLFPPTINAAGMPVFPATRPNPAFGRFSVNESSAHSSYDGMVLSARQRFGKRVQLQANYTLARTRDDDSNERTFNRDTALNPFDLSIEQGPSKQDVRHLFQFNALTDLPGGFTFTTIVLTRSAFPFNPVIGFDTQNDGNDTNDRAIINGMVAGRFSGREAAFFNWDMRLLKAFRAGEGRHLDITAEGFNVTGASNKNFGPDSESLFGTAAKPNPTAGQPLVAPSTARFGGPRQVQLGVRFVF